MNSCEFTKYITRKKAWGGEMRFSVFGCGRSKVTKDEETSMIMSTRGGLGITGMTTNQIKLRFYHKSRRGDTELTRTWLLQMPNPAVIRQHSLHLIPTFSLQTLPLSMQHTRPPHKNFYILPVRCASDDAATPRYTSCPLTIMGGSQLLPGSTVGSPPSSNLYSSLTRGPFRQV